MLLEVAFHELLGSFLDLLKGFSVEEAIGQLRYIPQEGFHCLPGNNIRTNHSILDTLFLGQFFCVGLRLPRVLLPMVNSLLSLLKLLLEGLIFRQRVSQLVSGCC